MKKLVIANQKGGVGKTAFLVHLAWYLAEEGKKVLVVDLDTQGNASFTLSKFKSTAFSSSLFESAEIGPIQIKDNISLIESDAKLANIEKITINQAATNFKKHLATFEDEYDYCLIDTAPSFGVLLATALIATNFVVSPIELETYSIQGIRKMITTISNLKTANPNLKFLGMLPSKVDNRNIRHKKNKEALIKAYANLIIPYPISLRSSVADALASSLPVWKNKKSSARLASKEIKAVAEYLTEQMGA